MDRNAIIEQIKALRNSGIPMDEIYVNDGASEWGDDGACTTEQCESLLDEWANDGCLDMSRDEAMSMLVPAAEWLGRHGAL